MVKKRILILILSAAFVYLCGCREEVVTPITETEQVGIPEKTGVRGFYLLNEGNMGSNKATLDYYDFTTATYYRNLYPEVNPNVAKELGDVGNDLNIYGSRLYAVINASNKVEVMDASTAKRIGQIDIPNCRYIRFNGQYAYVTSYAGPVEINPDYRQIGYVAKIDTATLQIIDTCHVGYQPDGLEIVGDRLYVANSGGYMVPNYENTVSVINLNTFKETKRIEVALNLHHLIADNHGQLWVTSRGDYYGTPSKLYVIDTGSDLLTDSVAISASGLCLCGDSLFTYSAEFSYTEQKNTVSYGIVDVNTHKLLTGNFLADGNEKKIQTPYGIWINPTTKDIFLTDAKNYVIPGTLHCFSSD